MLGKLLSTGLKLATLPIDAGNACMDLLCGGDGSKESRNANDTPGSLLETARDRVAETLENLDRKP